MKLGTIYLPEIGQGKIRMFKFPGSFLRVKNIDYNYTEISLKPAHIRMQTSVKDFQDLLIFKDRTHILTNKLSQLDNVD